MTAVGDVLELSYGKALKQSERDGGSVPVVGSGGIVGGHSAAITDAPTIVVGRKGSIGSVTWIDGPAWPIDTAYFVKPRREDLDRRWVFWMLKSLRMETMNKSAAVPGLNRDDVYRLRICFPPLPEQRRIAAILDHADALRTKRRQVHTHLDSLSTAVFHAMFREAVATNPLSEVVDEFRYGTSNKSGESGFPTLRIPNVIDGAIDTSDIKTVDVSDRELARLSLQDGDLLFVRTNGNPNTVGRCAVFSHRSVAGIGYDVVPWIYAFYLIRARLGSGVDPLFVAAYLATQEGRRYLRDRSKTSAGQYNINIEGIGSIPIPRVDLRRQVDFAGRVRQILVQRTVVDQATRVDDELFASLQSRAFRGDL